VSSNDLFSQIALQKGFLDQDQVALVVEFYNIEGRRRHPADVGLDLGLLTAPQAEELKGVHNTSRSQIKAQIKAETRKPQAKPATGARRPAERGQAVAVGQLVAKAIEAGASDLHIHARTPPFIRLPGELRELTARAVDQTFFMDDLKEMLSERQWATLERRGEVDLCTGFSGGYRLRMNVFREKHGISAAFRLIPPEVPSLKSLNLPTGVQAITDYPQGLVLVAGPARCGKTTTLAALVRRINVERRVHVVTIEDPIEFIHPPEQATISQRSVGLHTKSYASALRAALREDPDVIVIGELRDKETVQVAMTAAETGHLVLGTLHTRDVPSTVARVLDAFGDHEEEVRGMLADSLRGVLVQNLVRGRGGQLVPVVELLFHNAAIANCIRKRKLHQIESLMQSGRGQNMITWADSVRELSNRGLITQKTAQRLLAEDGRAAL
jgi:twitching motility protein PilT